MFSHNENARVQDHPESPNKTHQLVLARPKESAMMFPDTLMKSTSLLTVSMSKERRKEVLKVRAYPLHGADFKMYKQNLPCTG